MFPDIPEEQVRVAVEGIARAILEEAGVLTSPVDAVCVANRLGLTVARDSVGAGTRARFVRLAGAAGGYPTIFVADEPRAERCQWAVAHEIGESRAYEVFAELGVAPIDAAPSAREHVANRLAGCLLVPDC